MNASKKRSMGGTNGKRAPKKGDRVRIVNVDLKTENVPRRYLDRRGTVLGVKKGVAEIGYKDRIKSMYVPVDKLERCV